MTSGILDVLQRIPLVQHEPMTRQYMPYEQARPHSRYVSKAVDENDLSLSRMFRKADANKLIWSSYGGTILIIGTLIMLFALFLYTATWIVTNDNVIAIQNNMNGTNLPKGGNSVGSNPDIGFVLSTLVTNIQFWFGYAILAFPISIYIFAF